MLKGKKTSPMIVINLSFKEFLIDPKEDKEKIEFVKCIQKQKYENVLYVVTIFDEKNVEKSISPYLKEPEKWIFKYNKLLHPEMKFSITDMLINTVELALTFDDAICLTINTDTYLKKGFLKNLASLYDKKYKISGMANRHRVYDNIDDFYKNTSYHYGEGNLQDGYVELFFFDAAIFKGTNAMNDLKRFRIDGWGCGEFIHNNLFDLYADKKINLFYWDGVSKILNEHPKSNLRYNHKNQRIINIFMEYYGLVQYGDCNYIELVFSFADIPLIRRIILLWLEKKNIWANCGQLGYFNTFKITGRYLIGSYKKKK